RVVEKGYPMPASLRAVIFAALQAAVGACLPLVATQSLEISGLTFVVVFGVSLLSNLFHLNITPQQELTIAAALLPTLEKLSPALAEVAPALLALLEHLRKPAPAPITVITPPAPTP